MKARRILAVLMTLALVASSAAVAHAGAGSGSGLEITLFDCYVIHNGPNSPYVLELTDQFGTRDNVHIGKARLLCTPTTDSTTIRRGPVLNGNFDPAVADHLKCYDIVPPAARPSAVVTINDPFGVETVALEGLSVLCSPATKTVLP